MIRPIEARDGPALESAFERLSPTSRYRRFMTPRDRLGQRTLAYLTVVDHHRHEALVAFDAVTRDGIGVARFVKLAGDETTAEVSVAVVDDWHRRGVGTALLRRLVERAREEGVTHFKALMLADNEPALGLIRELGDFEVVARDGSTIEVLIELPSEGVGAHLLRLLRASARELLRFRDPGGER